MPDSSDKAKEAPVHEEFDPFIGSEESPHRPKPEEPRDEVEEEELEEAAFPHLRRAYPNWVTYLLAILLLGTWLYISHLLSSKIWIVVLGSAIIVGLVALWRLGSNSTLKARLPPPGWKSEIEPAELRYLTPEQFDGMRFELSGSNKDDLDEHESPWAMRYSRDEFLWIGVLVLLAFLSLAGIFLVPHATVGGGGAELPQEVNLVWLWVILPPLCLLLAWLTYLIWDYKRLMFDEHFIYDLLENPAWIPFAKGKKDLIPMSNVWSADPEDTSWGKVWGHGTVVVTYQEGMGNTRQKKFRGVPRHREVCDAINGLKGGSGEGMY